MVGREADFLGEDVPWLAGGEVFGFDGILGYLCLHKKPVPVVKNGNGLGTAGFCQDGFGLIFGYFEDLCNV